MARIRSIHPGLMTDEAFMTLTVEHPLAIVLLLGLLMESDDQGIFEWKPFTLKARILPAVSDDVGKLLAILEQHKFVMRYDLGDKRLGAVRNFCRFQKPKKPNYVHPKTRQVEEWVAFKAPSEDHEAPREDAPLENQFPTGGEIPRQREEGGDKGKENQPTSPVMRLRVGLVRAFEEAGNPRPPDTSRAEVWLNQGYDTDLILSVVRTVLKSNPNPRTLSYFEQAIKRAHDERPSGSKAPKLPPNDPNDPLVSLGQNRDGDPILWPESTVTRVVGLYVVEEFWPEGIGPEPGRPGCRIPDRLLPEKFRQHEEARH